MSKKDRHSEGSFGSHRRDVLRAVGAGTALSALAGVGAASEHGSDGKESTDEGCWCLPCIDRLSGYTALADDEDEWPARPDHVIDMYVEPRQVLFQQIPTEETDVEPGATPGGPEAEQFPDFFFDPVGLHIEPGDVVDFYNESPSLHTVTAFTERYSDPPWLEAPPRRVPADVPPFSSPLLAAEEHWLYKFDDPGVYDLYCLPHYGLGMVVRLVVGEGDFEEPGGTEQLPTAEQTVFGAPEMSVENVVEEGSVAWDDLTIEERLDPDTLFEEEG